MKRLVLVAALLSGGAQAQNPAMDEGQTAGRLIACAANPDQVFRFWRWAEPTDPGMVSTFSMDFLAGLMVGQKERVPARVCMQMLAALRDLVER
ncbi:MAG: hypothetical protein JWR10_310 [Rubritepida sp.]|nr:hypothetical protein [Rubritepida sp.]